MKTVPDRYGINIPKTNLNLIKEEIIDSVEGKIMFPTIILVPAYGRKYTSKQAVLADWQAGKDFKIVSGPYTSIRDKESLEKEYRKIGFLYGKKLNKHFYLDQI